jgi:hypothetical protein
MTAPGNNASFRSLQASGIGRDTGWDWRQWVIGSGSCLLLFLCMTFPTIPQLVILKASLLGVVLLTIAWDWAMSGRPRLCGGIACWTLFLAMTGFFFVLRGMLASNLGASSLIYVYVCWPIAFTVWISGFTGDQIISWIDRTAILATLFTGLYACLYLLTQLHLVPDVGLISALSFGWEDQSFGIYEGYTEMAIAGMNTFPFLLPYVMASIAIEPLREGRTRFWRVMAWMACALGWLTVLVAGRRVLLLIILVTPVLILTFRSFRPAREKLANRYSIMRVGTVLVALMVLMSVGLGLAYDFSPQRVWDNLVISVDLSAQTADPHAMERREQFFALTRGWLEKPLLGAGLGASALGSIRSETTPWAYEFSYLALLFQTGLLGFLAYTAGVVWTFVRGVRIVREAGQPGLAMLPMLVGLSGLLIANATNPYLLKFDGMWMLFLPLAVINYRFGRMSEAKLSPLGSAPRLSR